MILFVSETDLMNLLTIILKSWSQCPPSCALATVYIDKEKMLNYLYSREQKHPYCFVVLVFTA